VEKFDLMDEQAEKLLAEFACGPNTPSSGGTIETAGIQRES